VRKLRRARERRTTMGPCCLVIGGSSITKAGDLPAARSAGDAPLRGPWATGPVHVKLGSSLRLRVAHASSPPRGTGLLGTLNLE
jgi:hypothetical protein